MIFPHWDGVGVRSLHLFSLPGFEASRFRRRRNSLFLQDMLRVICPLESSGEDVNPEDSMRVEDVIEDETVPTSRYLDTQSAVSTVVGTITVATRQ